MDNHKPVMISIFGFKKKHEKDAMFFFFFFLMKNMFEIFLGFGRMQQNIFSF